MSIWKYADWIAPVDSHHRITLGEGNTPLVRSRSIGPNAGLPNLHFKLESTNPTGSFKDRFAAAAVSHMLQAGESEIIATSSGNTGASLAAYAAAAGITSSIAIVEVAPLGKLLQMLAYGAGIYKVEKFGLDPDVDKRVFRALKQMGRQPGCALQVSGYVFCPEGMSGLETVGFELGEQLPEVEHVFVPSGGGGLCVATARGFAKLVEQRRLERSPAVHCVQPEGNDTIATPLREGRDRARNVECTSKISGLQVSRVVDGHLAIEACRPTGGTGHTVTDEAIWHVQKRLAREEGLFVEPAAAVALTGALQAVERSEVPADAPIVCLLTGIGFKDASAVERMNANVECPTLDLITLERQATT
ncbi:MAG: pyridoxal-phosphate dependent enzyme [Planctomycetaceae bacterium]|nr:pyridoxal-phosphate dependent enzyme [Planctomycetaceae bacterium]